jgi:cold-inducible RNA-binding protein
LIPFNGGAYLKIFVGNLSYQVSEDELRGEFMAFGNVASVSIASDRYDNRPKGFGFVEMPTKSEAQAAIIALNGKVLKEKAISVNEARPKSDSRGSNNNRRGSSFGGRQGGGRSSERGRRSY